MTEAVRINLEKPVNSAKLLDAAAAGPESSSAPPGQTEVLELQGQGIVQACQALQDAAKKVNEFQENIFREHKEQITKLSIEIARKILRQETDKGNYQIEAIVKDALESSPTTEDVVVHLHPEDLAQAQEALKDDFDGALANVKLAADANINRAECVLETPKGAVECFIDAQLERIGEALANAE